MNTTTLKPHSVEYYKNFYAEKYQPVKDKAIAFALKRLEAWNKEPETPIKKMCVQNLSNILTALGAWENA